LIKVNMKGQHSFLIFSELTKILSHIKLGKQAISRCL